LVTKLTLFLEAFNKFSLIFSRILPLFRDNSWKNLLKTFHYFIWFLNYIKPMLEPEKCTSFHFLVVFLNQIFSHAIKLLYEALLIRPIELSTLFRPILSPFYKLREISIDIPFVYLMNFSLESTRYRLNNGICHLCRNLADFHLRTLIFIDF
jgi:hypothetical protein